MAHAPAARGAENQRDEAVVYESGKQGSSSPSVTGGNCAAHRRGFEDAGWRVAAGYQFTELPLSSDAPPTIRHPQYFPCNARLPPWQGGVGGGRAALDYPPDSTPQTPRCARCFRRLRGPFPETRPPPPDPPLAGGELCCAQGGFVAWVGVRVAGVGSGEFPPASDAPPTIRHPQYSPCNARLPPSQGGNCAAHRRGVGVRGKGDARGHLSRCRRPASRRRPSTATGWRP